MVLLFTTLYDYWMYGDLFKRENGIEVKVGITPAFGMIKDANRVFKERNIGVNIEPRVSFIFEKPIDLKWQHSASLNTSYTFSENWIKDMQKEEPFDNPTSTVESKYLRTILNGEYFIGYYPNSRTNLRLGLIDYFSWNKNLF